MYEIFYLNLLNAFNFLSFLRSSSACTEAVDILQVWNKIMCVFYGSSVLPQIQFWWI